MLVLVPPDPVADARVLLSAADLRGGGFCLLGSLALGGGLSAAETGQLTVWSHWLSVSHTAAVPNLQGHPFVAPGGWASGILKQVDSTLKCELY